MVRYVAHAWWTGPVCSDGCPNGYGVYEVNGSEIKWFYKSTGKAKDHQFRIYPKGSFSEIASGTTSGNSPETTPANQQEIGVNIWNWDPKWKVEYFEDGVNKGEMKQRTAMDPIAYKLYGGPLVPKKHKWVEPTLTDHLFFATPAPGTRQFKVVATDRFGSAYTEEITL
ncbi:calcineurin-like phosphoesterase C-terminal domain-containing protein [Pedobacter sp. NJ-S-72]